GMAIRFLSESVNAMGRIASGVTGISLKEDDEAISGSILSGINNKDEIAIDDNRDKDITLVTKNKEKKLVNIKDIRIQNRAGRGTNVMVINLDDEIIEVQYS
ncbi:MAG: DNA topoisomerase IV subunit A, partial [Romboutsia sp.]|nr:DNA topoisomerase IV subunit A [Romboutsia sp.]